jgi:pyrophosphatase PpaX
LSPTHGWRGVFFDLDGTLADTVELILQSFRHTMSEHLGRVLPDERWISTMGTPLRDQLRDFARSDEEAAAMLETYTVFQRGVHDEMVRPFPGAKEVLGELMSRGSRVAVVTSKRGGVARRTMEVCGLWHLVELVVSADDVTRGKPDPEPVHRALRLLDLDGCADEVVFVGDSPFDLRAGRAAGTRTAAVSWGPFARTLLDAERPDYVLGSLNELLALAPEGGAATRPR